MYWHWNSKVVILQEGMEPLPRCNQCGMHIPEAQQVNKRRMEICEKATEIWITWRDVDIAKRCGDMESSLYGRDGDVLVEGVAKFKYLGPTPEQTYDDCTAVLQNVKQARMVWGIYGKML